MTAEIQGIPVYDARFYEADKLEEEFSMFPAARECIHRAQAWQGNILEQLLVAESMQLQDMVHISEVAAHHVVPLHGRKRKGLLTEKGRILFLTTGLVLSEQ